MLSDALGSVGAMVAAVFAIYGNHSADAVMSLVIGLLVLVGTWTLVRDSAAVLLEFSPKGLSVAEVREHLSGLNDVDDVHDLHVWSLDGRSPIVSAHLVQDPKGESGEILQAAERLLLERFEVRHSTLQIEKPDADPCRARECCSLLVQRGVNASL
jgi:cobalt-zinc-cadmium efflux system protein